MALPGLNAAAAQAARQGWSRRLWAKDASLWTGGDEARWLGWLAAGHGAAVDMAALAAFQTQVKAAGYDHALLLGMGGSSLGPEVLAQTFGAAPGFPKLMVLDSTDPGQISRTEALIDPARTLYIVASKSGSTLEPDILCRYFWAKAQAALGAGRAGAQFVAITDPGSKLEATARRDGFGHVFAGDPTIGGRYSILSPFGLVPAAVLGLDVAQVLASTAIMARACGPSAPPGGNPGLDLGLYLGVAAENGRNKLTIVASAAISSFGAWLEQLVAESTGKQGQAIIPIDGEALGPPQVYGPDRLFAHLRLDGDATHDAALAALEAAGYPVIRISMSDRYGLFQEFFRWQVATAIAGAVMGIHPFDQPDVEASKFKTRALTDAYEVTGALAVETPVVTDGHMRLYADPENAAILAAAAAKPTLEAWLTAHFGRSQEGDYLALLAYLDRDQANVTQLNALQNRLRDRLHRPVAVGFGPRFLHSTGQAYKGGPGTGVFLQITAAPAVDLAIPGLSVGFAVVEAAQAQGDLGVLIERGRRALRVDLGQDVAGGLARIAAIWSPPAK